MNRVTIKTGGWSVTFPMKGTEEEVRKKIREELDWQMFTADSSYKIEPETRKWLLEEK